jgi:hypothetical protein
MDPKFVRKDSLVLAGKEIFNILFKGTECKFFFKVLI